MRGGCRSPAALTALRTMAPHLVQLGLVGLEVIGDAGPDLLGLTPKNLPEVGCLLALGEESDLCFALPLVLVDLLSEEPVAGVGEMAGGIPAPPAPQPALPGLGSAAQRGLAPTPHEEVEAVVQEENKAGGYRGERTVRRKWGAPSVLPTPGALAEQDTAAAGAAKWGLDPHPCRKVLARLIFTPELQL